MRKTTFAVAALAIAVVSQLSVLNGLRLPGGGVPDLVLVLVAAIAVVDGPLPGMVLGFAAGLCLDLAPPASQLIGQYALVFCLAGWAAGRLGGMVARSALRSAAVLAVVVVAAEALAAALGLALEPAEVTAAEVRVVLPATIAYDLLLTPFVLYLVYMASSVLTDGLGAPKPVGLLAVPEQARKRGRKRPHQPRLDPAAGRAGDGWVGSAPRGPLSQRAPVRRTPRLRPAGGVAGSAATLVHRPGVPVPTVSLRFASGRRGDGTIGNMVAGFGGQLRQRGRHPGQLGGASRFRPHGGELGGSAAGQPRHSPAPARGRKPIRFAGHRGNASLGSTLGHTSLGDLRFSTGSQALAVRRPAATPKLRFSAGSRAPAGWRPPTPKLRFSTGSQALAVRRPAATPKLRFSTGSQALAVRRPAATPKLRFSTGSHAPASKRPAAAPKFRRTQPQLRSAGATFGLVAGGVLDQSAFRVLRRQRAGTPRLRLGRSRRGSGVVGGSALAVSPAHPARLARPATPRFRLSPLARGNAGLMRKQPKFGYGRRSLLSVLSRSRIGGKWLARRRVGSRSGLTLIRRAGGTR
jgi:rod shape-determining protein MreD